MSLKKYGCNSCAENQLVISHLCVFSSYIHILEGEEMHCPYTGDVCEFEEISGDE